MAVTFAVDDVVPADELLPTHPLGDDLGNVLACGTDLALPVVNHGPTHALLGATRLAFSQHRPLVLSPDAVWLTIAQGVTSHVELNAEELRPLFVRHAGRATLTVRMNERPRTDAEWAAVVPRLCEALEDERAEGVRCLFECDFSTSTQVERIVGQIILLEAFAPYYDYWLLTICGIPEITLTGSVEDWQRIRARVDVFQTLGLEKWVRSLGPILDHFVRAAQGTADVSFWRRIYNPRDAYGGQVINGWIARFYPYLDGARARSVPNPLLDLSLREPRRLEPGDPGPGITADMVGFSPCSARVQIAGGPVPTAITLEGGVRFVRQDAEGRLLPCATWSVRKGQPAIAALAARLVSEHGANGAPKRERGEWVEGPGDVVGLYSLTDGASLFGGAWVLRRWSERRQVRLASGNTATVVIDLSSGASLGFVMDGIRADWVQLDASAIRPEPPGKYELRPQREASNQPAEDIQLVGHSLAELLERALDTGGAPPQPLGPWLRARVDRMGQ